MTMAIRTDVRFGSEPAEAPAGNIDQTRRPHRLRRFTP